MTAPTANDLYDMYANQADPADLLRMDAETIAEQLADIDEDSDIADYAAAAAEILTIARQLCAAKYGTVTSDGITYTLIDVADMSSRLMPYKPFHQAQEGDEYDFEMVANAVDDEGNPYQIAWIFAAIKGDEPELDSYDYSTPHSVSAK